MKTSREHCYLQNQDRVCLQRKDPCFSGRLGRLIGQGTSGSVFGFRFSFPPGDSTKYALKIIPIDNDNYATRSGFQQEVSRTRLASEHGLGPKVHGHWYCKGTFQQGGNLVSAAKNISFGLLLSDYVPGQTVTQYKKQYGWTAALEDSLLRLFQHTVNQGFTSVDLHGGNVIVNPIANKQYSKKSWTNGPLVAQFIDLDSLQKNLQSSSRSRSSKSRSRSRSTATSMLKTMKFYVTIDERIRRKG